MPIYGSLDGTHVLGRTRAYQVTFILPIWLVIQGLTLVAQVALIKIRRSHTCAAAWLEVAQCQAAKLSQRSGISYRAVLPNSTTAAVKRPLILDSQHVTTRYASVSIVEWSQGSVSYPFKLCANYSETTSQGHFCHHMTRL